jgi:hypothetical protein
MPKGNRWVSSARSVSLRTYTGPTLACPPAKRLLEANKDRFGQVTTGSRRRGEETWVYGRAGRPCRLCGTPVRTADQGSDPESRVTFWCPTVRPDFTE